MCKIALISIAVYLHCEGMAENGRFLRYCKTIWGEMYMLKRIFLGIVFLLTSYVPAYSAEIANVEYVHSLINKVWDIDVPYYEDSLKYAANMEYLLKAVDKANEILNGAPITDYGNSEYATLYAADTVATKDAVNRLIEKFIESEFYITTTPSTSSFSFYISAAGEYEIDWGDGNIEAITKSDTTATTYSHTYDTAGEYTIGLGGQATAYNRSTQIAAVSFRGNTNIAEISGSLGEVFSTLSDGSQPRFYNTFSGCGNLTGSIPENLFAGITGAPTSNMFNSTFSGCRGLTGEIPENLFAGIKGSPAMFMFYYTFAGCNNLTGSIPAGLFAGITGSPAIEMFSGTFNGCTGLTGIPAGLFDGITDVPANGMFSGTFNGCRGLTGPSARMSDGTYLYDYFKNASSIHVGNMYAGATGLEDYPCIPTAWGGAGGVCTPPIESEFYITTTPDTGKFDINISAAGEYEIDWGDGKTETITKSDTTLTTYTHNYDAAGEYTIGLGGQATDYNNDTFVSAIRFADNTNIAEISGSLGEVFSTLSDGSQPSFYQAFYNCTNLVSIPESLFTGVTGAPIVNMFGWTFRNCNSLTSIPEGLFASIQGAPAINAFNSIFYDCSSLTSIPAGLFAGIQGAPAEGMFGAAFSKCVNLTSLPSGLFSGITGSPVAWMYSYIFDGCTGLQGEIPLGFFGNLSGDSVDYAFDMAFNGCSKLTGPSARQPDGTYLYEYFGWGGNNMYTGATGLSDYQCIPTWWGGAGGVCTPPIESEFYITTTPTTNSFSFKISAAGEYEIDWGDGKTETITKSDTTTTTYSHTYDTAGEYTIGLGGQATAYNSGTQIAAVSFSGNTNIAGISGSLGEIFSTLSDGTQPRFYYTFSNCSNLKGSIPAGLFAGITGAPAEFMFSHTFDAWITGAPAEFMFSHTFDACRGLTGSIPENLFAGIMGAPAEMMFQSTFNGCSGLTSIPENLFAGIKGAPARSMFHSTFDGCSGLTSIPENLFAGIKGAPAGYMFFSIFNGCSGLTGEIPLGLFGTFTSNTPQNYMFYRTFNGCTGLTGPSARQPDGTYLYDYFNTATSSHVGSMYRGATGLSDYQCIPTAWGGAGGVCTPPIESEFYITTTPSTSSFSFQISAAGEYEIDWGDGKTETITKSDTTMTTYTHNYDVAGEYTIGLGGQATAYNTSTTTAAVSFNGNIAGISGSLGEVFSTLSDGSQPRFFQTFVRCNNLKGSIPENLFAGIKGAPTESMFNSTFTGCSGLTGSIPAGLFAGITGAPAELDNGCACRIYVFPYL